MNTLLITKDADLIKNYWHLFGPATPIVEASGPDAGEHWSTARDVVISADQVRSCLTLPQRGDLIVVELVGSYPMDWDLVCQLNPGYIVILPTGAQWLAQRLCHIEYDMMPTIMTGDVVTILDGTNEYDVTETCDDMARIWPKLQDDTRDGQWIGIDLLRSANPRPADLCTDPDCPRLSVEHEAH